ncbi:glycosyltransferase family 4 protein [Tessaracoccus sp. Y36]
MAEPTHWEELLAEDLDFVVVAPTYPRAWRHGGEFIRSRVHAYVAAGLRGAVIDTSGEGSRVLRARDSATEIFVTHTDDLPSALDVLQRRGVPVLAHSPSPTVSGMLTERLPGLRLIVWYHGYEVRDYRRLAGNFTTAELALRRATLDELNRVRFDAARSLFSCGDAAIVFVSEMQRQNSQWDVGAEAVNSHVIPNHIDTAHFRARERQPHEANRILLMRSFEQRNYGNDIAINAIGLLKARPGFFDLQFTVRGFGRLFQRKVAPLHGLPNVTVENRYSSPSEMAALHYDHGIFLCPSRYDTQGVMLGEAMASGMVTITNPVAAIPEYTDATCSLLPRPDDPRAFAEAIWYLVEHPEVLPELSRNAAARVERQCGVEATINRELDLIRTFT